MVNVENCEDMLGKLRTKRALLMQEVTEVDKRIDAVITTLGLLSPDWSDNPYFGLREQIIGVSHIEQMVIMAKQTGGRIRIKEVCRTLVQFGAFKRSTKNAYNLLTRLLRESDVFERMDVGTYSLIKWDKPRV